MSNRIPTKSILKQSSPNKPDDEKRAKAEKDKRNLSIALNHATRIDLQKRIQLQIVQNIETLLSLPTNLPTTTSTSQSSSPSAQDCRTFTTRIHPFQPSDFASLVEERRINGTCGYALCSKPPRTETLGPSASWKLKGKGAADFCSTACVRKALYVKAQLSEVPAWERVGGQQGDVVLPPEDRVVGGDAVGYSGSGSEGGARREQVANARDLAAERGEEPTSFKPRQVMMDSVVEKARSKSSSAPAFPQRPTTGGPYGAIEGYESKFSAKRDGDDDSDDDEGGSADTYDMGFSSEIRVEDDETFDEEEEAAWREMQAGLQQLNTRHDR